jgi:tetratricopeptide (TPR) repeat protein
MHSKDTVPVEQFKVENDNAEAAITAREYSEAARILVAIVDQDPSNHRAFNNMGILCWARKNWDDAYNLFLKAISLRPDYTDALVNAFDAALKLKKINDILPCLEHACSIDPSLEEIAILRDSIREQGDGIYSSRRALAIGIYSPLIEEARHKLEAGMMDQAMELFLRANDEEGPSADSFCGLGIISYHQERYGDAFVLFTESVKLNPTDTDTFLNLADAAKACGRTADAKVVFSTYRKDFPDLNVLDDTFSAL